MVPEVRSFSLVTRMGSMGDCTNMCKVHCGLLLNYIVWNNTLVITNKILNYIFNIAFNNYSISILSLYFVAFMHNA